MSKIIEFSLPTAWEWVWQVLALLLIIWILKKLMFQPVTDFLEKRKDLIANDIKTAADVKAQATSLKEEYDGKIKNINDESDRILTKARQKALDREVQIIEEAKNEANAIKAKAKHDTELELEKVRADMKDEMINVATLMASKFVKSELTHEKQEEIITEIIDEMGDVSWL
ncbi:MAG: ATP synthase F0 subunit B [Candidatus Epulonipiscioides saccharophilum]|nr:MAG: ATP synthase F0 subunit B [Epulopiscium sp. AS2M-Bin001]